MTLNVPKKGPVGYILSNKLQLYKQILHEHKKQAQCCTVFSCYTMLPPSGFLCHFRFPKLDLLKMTPVQSRQLVVTFLAISQVSSIYFQERLDWTLGQYMATFVTIDLTRG